MRKQQIPPRLLHQPRTGRQRPGPVRHDAQNLLWFKRHRLSVNAGNNSRPGKDDRERITRSRKQLLILKKLADDVLLRIGDGNKFQPVGMLGLVAHDSIEHHGGALVDLGQFDLNGFALTQRTRQDHPQPRLADVLDVAGKNIAAFDHTDFRVPGAALMPPSGWSVVSYGAILRKVQLRAFEKVSGLYNFPPRKESTFAPSTPREKP